MNLGQSRRARGVRVVHSMIPATFALALFVTGCGGSDSEGTGPSDGSAGALGSTGGAIGTGANPSGGITSGGNGGIANAGAGGTGNVSGTGGGPPGTGGRAGSGGAADSGAPSVCPGSAPPPTGYRTCRTVADCPNQIGGYVCQHDPVGGCGIGPPPPACYSDGNCTNGQVCLVVAPVGCSGASNHCVPPCTSTSCSTDEVCGTNGHCQPKPCTAGYACPGGTVCGPSRTGADGHGCAPASCSTDGYACPADYACTPSPTADAHGCSDVSCTKGFTCPENFDCNPASTALHQCDRRRCTTDANCDCGACIQGACEDRLFVCSQPPA